MHEGALDAVPVPPLETDPVKPAKSNKLEETADLDREFERIKSNSETPEERAKAFGALMRTVADRRNELATLMQREQNQLGAARAKLSLPEGGTAPSHWTEIEEERKALDTLYDKLENELSETNRENEGVKERMELAKSAKEFGEMTMGFLGEIHRRAQNDMDTFMDVSVFNAIKSCVAGLNKFSEGNGADKDELNLALGRMSMAIKRMDQTRRGGPIRENTDSLNRLAFGLQEMNGSLNKMRRQFSEGDENESAAAHLLTQSIDGAYDFVGRVQTAFQRYSGS